MDYDPDPAGFPPRHYVLVLWRRKYLIAAVVLLAAVVGILLRPDDKRSFASTAEVLLQPRTSETLFPPTDAGSGSSAVDQSAVKTEIEVMKSRSITDAVVDELGAPGSLDVSIEAVEGTQVVAIRAEANDPRMAQSIAQTYAETYITIRKDQLVTGLLAAIDTVQVEIDGINAALAELDPPLAALDEQLASAASETIRRALEVQREEVLARRQPLLSRRSAFEEEIDQLRLAANLTETGGAQVISDASPPRRLRGTGAKQTLLASLAVGAILGVVLALVREHFDETVKNKAQLEADTLGALVLGVIPQRRRWPLRKPTELVTRSSPRSGGAEAYRALRTSVEFVAAESGRIIQITSPSPDDGKSLTVANLGMVMARAGRQVVLVDCNLRKPRLHQIFGLDNERGFTTAVLDEAPVGAACQIVPGEDRLRVVTAGPPARDPSEMLARPETARLLRSLAAEADFVLVDSPPVLPVTDAVVLAAAVETLVLLARARHTVRSDIARAYELLDQVQAPGVGTILNGADTVEARASEYGEDRRPYGDSERRAGSGRQRRSEKGARGQRGTSTSDERAPGPSARV